MVCFQLKTAKELENDGTPRLHEQFGYAYDAAWNLSYRTNNALVQTFNVNSLNELSSATRSGTFTVAGMTTLPGRSIDNVTVGGTGLSTNEAEVYADGSWTRTNATLTDRDNSYTATAEDTAGRTAQDSVSVNLPSTATFVYDLNGNLRTNNSRIFEYDLPREISGVRRMLRYSQLEEIPLVTWPRTTDLTGRETQLTRITEPGSWKSDFSYDGLLRRRVRTEYVWNGSKTTAPRL